MKTEKELLTDLATFIADECKAIDPEARFDDMLDECYSFDAIGGPFAHMSPSRVLKECDPTAYRCGVNDYADGEDWVEVGGDYYDRREAERARDEFVSTLEDEVTELEEEIEELEAEDADRDEDDSESNADKVAELSEQLKEWREIVSTLSRVDLSSL